MNTDSKLVNVQRIRMQNAHLQVGLLLYHSLLQGSEIVKELGHNNCKNQKEVNDYRKTIFLDTTGHIHRSAHSSCDCIYKTGIRSNQKKNISAQG